MRKLAYELDQSGLATNGVFKPIGRQKVFYIPYPHCMDSGYQEMEQIIG